MKNYVLFALLLFSIACQKEKLLISFESANAQQAFLYDFQNRQYDVKDLSHSEWPYVEQMITDDAFSEIGNDEMVFRRKLQILIPEEQAGEYHIESMTIELAMLVDKAWIDQTNHRFLSNEQFQSAFLEVGDWNIGNRIAKISYHQTYWIAHYIQEDYETTFQITEVEAIAGMENAFLISGFFATDWDGFSDLTNGQFSFIINN